MALFDADFLIYPSFSKESFNIDKKRDNISEKIFKNNQGLTFILLDGVTSGQEKETPLWKWRSYYLKQNDDYFGLSCLNEFYDITGKKWIIKNSEIFCDTLVGQIKITK